MRIPSTEFQDAVRAAIMQARSAPDDAVRYMSDHIPIWAMYEAEQSQKVAGGCPNCFYLGLWARDWPGYNPTMHGIIFLFESGIRQMGGELYAQTYSTLLHEFNHALQKDHVLDQMERVKRGAAGQYVNPNTRGCGCR